MHQIATVGVTHSANFMVTIVFANTGTNTWNTAGVYQLGFQAPGDTNWGMANVSVPSSIGAGSAGTFAVTFTAPSTAGVYPFQWRMNANGSWFGEVSDLAAIQVI